MSMMLTSNITRDRKTSPEGLHGIKISSNETVSKMVKPLVVSMSLFGLLFLKRKTNKFSRITKGYTIFILVLMWMRFLQLFFVYRDEHFGEESAFKVTVHLWYLHSCVNATITYRACNNENRFVEFLLKWSSLLRTNRGISPNDTGFSTSNYESGLKKRLNLLLAIAWIVFILGVVTHTFFLFSFTMLDFTIAPTQPSQSFALPLKVMVTFVHIYVTASWVLTLSMFIMISVVIYKEFEIFHDDLRKAISADGDVSELELFRRRHDDICNMVETADDILSPFNAAGICICTTEAMLTLYSTVKSPHILADPILLASHCFWVMQMLLYFVIIAYGGGYLNHMGVASWNPHFFQHKCLSLRSFHITDTTGKFLYNDKAHAPLKTIHRVRAQGATVDFSLQITMFLNKLSGETIGLTALGLFVIDKPTILTIAGAFITYFIVLLQFHQTNNSDGTPQFNCTELLTNTTLECFATSTN